LWHIPKNKLAKKLLMMILKSTAVVVCIALLGACSSSPNGIRVTKDGTSATSSKQGAAIRDFTSAEIGSAVVGKTFQYTRKDGTGFVVYNADGSLTITDDQKGASKGTWKVFKYTGDAYFAANSRLVEMKI
jgi:hypothetical protein